MVSANVITVLVLMIVYLIIGVVQIATGIFRFSKNGHGCWSITGTTIIGLGMFIYRLMPEIRTTYVKLIHMCIMLIGVGCIICGIFQINHKQVSENKYESMHRYPGYIVYVTLVLQVLLALFFFICLYNRRVRYYVAPFHDMIGIWIYIVLLGCCITGAHKWEGLPKNDTTLFINIEIIAALVNVSIVLVVVLSPYLEWEIVL